MRFEAAIRALLRDGFTTFVEVSPHPVLTTAVLDTIEATGADPDGVAAIGTLRRDEGGSRRFTTSLAEAHVHGCVPDWGALCAAPAARRVELPDLPLSARALLVGGGRGCGATSPRSARPRPTTRCWVPR